MPPPPLLHLIHLKRWIKFLVGQHWSLHHYIGGGELLPCFFPRMNDNFRHVLNYEAPLTAGNVGTCPRGALEQGHCHQGWSIELQIMEGILFSWQWLVLLNQNDATLIPLRIFLAEEIRPARLFSLCNFANSADCPPKFPILSSPVSSLPEGFKNWYWAIDPQMIVGWKLHSQVKSRLFCRR